MKEDVKNKVEAKDVKKADEPKTPNGQKGSVAEKPEAKKPKEPKEKVEAKKPKPNIVTGRIKFSSRVEFEDTLKVAQDFIEKRSLTSIPSLSCIHLTTAKDTCKIEVTDLAKSWVKTIPCSGDALSRCVPLDTLFKEVRALPADIDTIEMRFKETAVHINGRCQIFTLPSDDFPVIKDFEGTKVEVKDLREKIKRVIPAASKDDYRRALNSIFINFDKGHIIATDGHRLHYEDTEAVKSLGTIMIPYESARLIAKYAGSSTMKIGKGSMSLIVSGGRMITTLNEGNCPDYSAVLSGRKENNLKVAFKGSDFLKIVEGSLPFTTGSIVLTIADQLTINSQNLELGQYKWHIPCEIKGKGKQDYIIGFNPSYLTTAISAYAKDDKVLMEMGDPLSPCFINSKAVVMPVRV